jgi:putative membrane protein
MLEIHMKTPRPIVAMLALCVGLSVTAYAQNATQATMPTAQPPGSAAAASSSEREALGVLSAINTSEINAANLVLQKQAQGGVRDYATRMVKQHTDNNQTIAKWSPDTAAAGAKLQMSKGKTELKQLQKLEGRAAETAYIAAMVKDHTDALAALADAKALQASTQSAGAR